MLKIYDKAKWHIDGGEHKDEVIERMKIILQFLNRHGLLTEEGIEELEIGVDSSCSIHEKMLTADGIDYMDKYYDSIIALESDQLLITMEKLLKESNDAIINEI